MSVAISRLWCETCGDETLHAGNRCVHCNRERRAAAVPPASVNTHHRGPQTYVRFEGANVSLRSLAKRTGISFPTLHRRWQNGDVGDALIRPTRKVAV